MPMEPRKQFVTPAGSCAAVRIIDTTSRIGKIPVEFLMAPPVPGYDQLPELPSWSFLIESPTGQKALFDLGVPKNWRDMAPSIVEVLQSRQWDIKVQNDTSEILLEHGYDLAVIGSIIWSHWHWDHLGDPSTFPSTPELVVGPGFKDNFMPEYPVAKTAPVRESDFAGRKVREVDFSGNMDLKIGDFDAIDFFGDGSFYLLDAPGHAVGHLCGLARTTDATFIMMGGDLCHHAGELRPSEHMALPEEIKHLLSARELSLPSCPGVWYEPLQTARNRTLQQPFFDPAMGFDIPEAKRTICKAQKADAEDHILFIYAHDRALRDVADFFPLSVNDWQVKAWKEKMLWTFLDDFQNLVHRHAKQRVMGVR